MEEHFELHAANRKNQLRVKWFEKGCESDALFETQNYKLISYGFSVRICQNRSDRTPDGLH